MGTRVENAAEAVSTAGTMLDMCASFCAQPETFGGFQDWLRSLLAADQSPKTDASREKILAEIDAMTPGDIYEAIACMGLLIAGISGAAIPDAMLDAALLRAAGNAS